MGSFHYEAFTMKTTTIGGGGDGVLHFVLQRWRQGEEGLMNGFGFELGARGTGRGDKVEEQEADEDAPSCLSSLVAMISDSGSFVFALCGSYALAHALFGIISGLMSRVEYVTICHLIRFNLGFGDSTDTNSSSSSSSVIVDDDGGGGGACGAYRRLKPLYTGFLHVFAFNVSD
ncbi:hypothetical protein BDN70DRAFT_900297 [Pholiota conissans]|uniref:Uncharacterized protein n=1 Tax=Pholiota conissans TaxID=109636 RepID=A0A9P5YQD4_9AGAR|nr:hypothetical protein BDN70DRAFT_900297 [Pholiota conissans]